MEFGYGKKYVYCYIYNEKQEHSPGIKISIDPKQIASFLYLTRKAYKVDITNSNDELEISTLPNTDGFVDICRDQEYLENELLPVLIPIQEEREKPNKVIILDWKMDDAKAAILGNNGLREWLNRIFRVEL